MPGQKNNSKNDKKVCFAENPSWGYLMLRCFASPLSDQLMMGLYYMPHKPP